MTVSLDRQGTKLTVTVEGKLDTQTSPTFDKTLQPELDGTTDLVIDLKNLNYISSAGLRVLLCAAQIMEQNGKMTIINANEEVLNVFALTGFDTLFTIV